MKISELRDKLSEIQNEVGDVNVVFCIKDDTYDVDDDDVCQCDLEDGTKVALVDLDPVLDAAFPTKDEEHEPEKSDNEEIEVAEETKVDKDEDKCDECKESDSQA